ncbi:retrovirus-related pol polyprotein from transposon TNT 1-94 [Tanacetum coccineum]
MTKRHSKEAEMTRTAKVIGNVLDAETRIILSENVRNHRETRSKKLSSEVLRAVIFPEHDSEITKDRKVIGRVIRKSGLYVMKLGKKPKVKICLTTIVKNSTLWHRRLGHANMRLIQSLASKELVRNLPKLKFDQHFCDACKIRKEAHASHKAKNIVLTTRCLELLHMDLFGPSAVWSYGGNLYTLVIVDDYSRYTWTRFLKTKTEAFEQFEIFSKKIQNQLGCSIVSIRVDHDREFDNEVHFGEFCNANGIKYNFSAPRTPQSNGVVERKNRTLQEMSRTMLNEKSLPQNFWCNVVDTSTYILNRILVRTILEKTPYELLRCRKPTLDYFKVFRSKCFILNTKDYLTKFDPKSYEGVFLGYSLKSKAYINTIKIKESLNMTFDETSPPFKTSPLVDDDLDEEEGNLRGRPSTSASSSSAFDHPSSSYYVDEDDDENDEGTSRASTPSPTLFVNSSSNDVPQGYLHEGRECPSSTADDIAYSNERITLSNALLRLDACSDYASDHDRYV